MEDIIDIIVTETTNTIEITAQPNDEIIDVNIIDNREDIVLNVTPTVVEININSLTGNFGVNWGDIDGTLSNQTDLQNALNLKADLVDGKVPSSQLPSYVDDIVEVATYSALPTTGETGKIYVVLDTNLIYRWSGSAYIEIKDSTAVWGAITGTLSSQTDLQSALNAKANDNAVVKLTGNQTINGTKAFIDSVITNNASEGATGEGLIAGQSFKIDGTGTSQKASMFMVSNVLSNTYASGLTAQFANFAGDKAFGFNLNTSGGFELYVKNTTFNKALAIANTMAATFGNSVTATSFIKSGGTSSQFLKADGTVDSTSYMPSITFISPLVIASGGEVSIGQSGASANGYLSYTDWNTFNNKLSTATAASTYVPYTGATGAVNLGAYDLTVNGLTIGKGASSVTNNTIIGSGAGIAITTGSSNTNIGFFSFRANTTGSANTSLGANTLQSGNGDNNTAIGAAVLVDNTASNNTGVGSGALQSNTSGSFNTALGILAGYNITTGSYNTIVGKYLGTTTLASNVVLADGQGNIRFQYNGTNTLLGQSGNVGIGTTSPSYNLDVRSSNALIQVKATGAAGNSYSALLIGSSAVTWNILNDDAGGSGALRFYNDSTATDAIRIIRSNNNVLIGTTSDAGYKLYVSGNTYLKGTTSDSSAFALVVQNSSATNLLLVRNDGAATFSSTITASTSIKSYGTDSDVQVGAAGTGGSFGFLKWDSTGSYMYLGHSYSSTFNKNLVIISGGAIGMNTTSPNTGAVLTLQESGSLGAALSIKNRNSTQQWDVAVDAFAVDDKYLSFVDRTNSAVRMNLSDTGKLYLGTGQIYGGSPSSDYGALTLYGGYSATPAQGSRMEIRGYEGGTSTQGAIISYTNNVERMRISQGGTVCIGNTTGAGDKLAIAQSGVAWAQTINHTNAGAQFFMDFRYNGTGIGSIQGSNTSTSYITSSDYRLKQDLKPIKGLEIVNKIKVYDYQWKSDNSRMDGVLAHELAEVLPYAVSGVKDGEQMQGVDYSKIVPVMVQAIKDLKAELDTLKNK
jgi:hypothetical protein